MHFPVSHFWLCRNFMSLIFIRPVLAQWRQITPNGRGHSVSPSVTWSLSKFLLRPLQRWRSFVMSTSVCLSVCLSVHLCVCLPACQDMSRTTRATFTNFSVHVVYGRGSIFRRQSDEIRRERRNLGVFLPIDRQCIVTRSLQKGSFNIGRKEGDGSAQRGRSVIYDCVVGSCIHRVTVT